MRKAYYNNRLIQVFHFTSMDQFNVRISVLIGRKISRLRFYFNLTLLENELSVQIKHVVGASGIRANEAFR